MLAAVVLQPERLREMFERISNTAHQSMQYSRRHKDVTWEAFAVLKAEFLEDGHRLKGHISNPEKKDIKFEIDWVDSEAPSLDIDHGGHGFAVALEILKREFPRFFARSKTLGKKGGGSGELEGIYLWAGVAGPTGKANLKEAVLKGMFSQDLAKTCLASGVTAHKFGA